MNSETSFALILLSAIFTGALAFLWWFFRDTLHRLEARADKLVDDVAQFRAESTGVHATLASRLTLIDEKVNVAMKKSEEHGAELKLLLPRVAVLEEEELVRQRREDQPDPARAHES